MNSLNDDEEALRGEADLAVARNDFLRAITVLGELTAKFPERLDDWLKLAAVQRAAGDLFSAMKSIDRALVLDPRNFGALLMRAQLFSLLGNADGAGEAFGRALANMPATRLPPAIATIVDRARQEYQSWQVRQAEMLREAVRKVGPLSAAVERMITSAVRLTEPDRSGPSHYCYPGLKELGFHNEHDFPWLIQLEAEVETIRSELDGLLHARSARKGPYIRYPEGVPTDQWATLNHNPNWSALHLIERGVVVEENARHCPKTMEALRLLPQPRLPNAGPNAMFSLLAPHTHIPPHQGVTNTRLLCHLPLIIPDKCWFRVGTTRRAWITGKAWVFDDTIEHEAMNASDELRVILIADIWHPDIPVSDQPAVAAVIRAGGRQIHGL